MGFFKKLFKGAASVVKTVGKVAGTVVKVASPALGLIPVVGPIASKIVDKLPLGLLSKADDIVQSSAIQHVISAAEQPPVQRQEALVVAKEAKLDIMAKTGDAALADQVGQATYEAATTPQLESVHIDQLAKILAHATVNKTSQVGELPETKEEKANVGDLLGKILKGAGEGAKNGAIDAFADSDQGKKLRDDAIKQQLNKYLPLALAGVVAYLLIKKK